jgi:predicted nuclease of predicted toxin-antitoxin system
MKLLANENFPIASKKHLANNGFDIVHIGETNGGISDEAVMKMAIAENRTILTFDRDYGELIFKYGYKPPKGVIYFRWNSYKPESPAQFFIELLKQNKIIFENIFTVIDTDSIRQRKY